MTKTLDRIFTYTRDLLARDANIDRLAKQLLSLCAEHVGHTALFYLAEDNLAGWRSCSGGQLEDISSWRIPVQSSPVYRKLFDEKRPVVCAPPELAATPTEQSKLSDLTGGAASICLAPLVIADSPAGMLLFGSMDAFSDDDAAALKSVADLLAYRIVALYQAQAAPPARRPESAPGPTRSDEEKMRRVLGKLESLPAMPNIAGKVLEMIEETDTSADDLQRIISNDPALTARILKVANSSYYCCGMDVSTLTEAVVMLGFNTLRSLVVAASVRSLYMQRPSHGPGSKTGTARFTLRQRTLWEHSVACAAISRNIAKTTDIAKPETAFIAGLLHDIGRLVICRQMSDEYERWLNQNAAILDGHADRPASLGGAILESEREVFSFDHCHVGAAVAGKWRLSRDLVEAISNHHNGEEDSPPSQLAAVVDLANIICMKHQIGPLALPEIDLKRHRDRLDIPLSDSDLQAMLDNLTRILAAESIFL